MASSESRQPTAPSAAVLDALPIIAWTADANGDPTSLSRAFERVCDVSVDEVLARGYAAFVHPEDLGDALLRWNAARVAGVAFRDELRIRAGAGRYRWHAIEAAPILEPGGAIASWLGTLTDIDDLRVAELQLEAALEAASLSARAAAARAELAYRLMEANDDSISVLDLEGRLLSLGRNGNLLPAGDAHAGALASWLGSWQGEHRSSAEAAFATARGGGRARFTAPYATPGEERFWEVTLTPIRATDGRPEQVLVMSRDVTEAYLAARTLALSESRYRVLTEAMPGETWSATPEGTIEVLTDGTGLRERSRAHAIMHGKEWLTGVHPDDREEADARWSVALASGDTYDALFRLLMQDGTYRWHLVRALPQRDDAGAIMRWVGVSLDVEDRRRADEAREQFARLAEATDDFIGIADLHGRMTYANAAVRSALEIGSLEDARSIACDDFFAADDRAFVHDVIMPAVEREGRWLGEFRFRNFRTGASIPVSFNAFSLHDDAGRVTGSASVARDLRDRRRLEIGMRALAEAGAAMYGSLDSAATIANVVGAVAQSFASWCSVEVRDARGCIHTLAARHRDPSLWPELERRLASRDLSAEHPAVRAIDRGESTLETLSSPSIVSVPIRSMPGGPVFGSLTCGLESNDPRGAFTAEDVRFAEEIAVRAALAIDHARCYERERRIAVTLQEASLPGNLPASESLCMSAYYRPGNSEATIGGDWYDAFALDDGRIAITIGDVLGNGLTAAVTMGKVRQAMQSVAMVVPDPNTILWAADRTVRAQSGDTYATALAGIFDPATHRFTFASAGHPGPLLRHPDGRIEEFVAPGLLLGLRSGGDETHAVQTAPGATLLFYTDGLVEATRDIDEGLRRVTRALADPAIAAAANPAKALVDRVLGAETATDDVAVLIAEIGPRRRA